MKKRSEDKRENRKRRPAARGLTRLTLIVRLPERVKAEVGEAAGFEVADLSRRERRGKRSADG